MYFPPSWGNSFLLVVCIFIQHNPTPPYLLCFEWTGEGLGVIILHGDMIDMFFSSSAFLGSVVIYYWSWVGLGFNTCGLVGVWLDWVGA